MTNGKEAAVAWHLPRHRSGHFRDAVSLRKRASIASRFALGALTAALSYEHGMQWMRRLENEIQRMNHLLIVRVLKQFYDDSGILLKGLCVVSQAEKQAALSLSRFPWK